MSLVCKNAGNTMKIKISNIIQQIKARLLELFNGRIGLGMLLSPFAMKSIHENYRTNPT